MLEENKNLTLLEKKAFSKIGEVIEVEGKRAVVKVSKDKSLTNLFFNGEIYRNVGLGSYIKIEKDFLFIVGKISKEYLKENIRYRKDNTQEKDERFIEVMIIGTMEENKFKRGIKELPFLYNEAFLMSEEEVKKIYYLPTKNKINVGESLFEEVKIDASVTKLFASHIGIFGNTGSGKSNTLSRLYHNLFKSISPEKLSNSKFIILDFNGEYTNSNSIVNNKNTVELSTRRANDKLTIDQSWLDEEFWGILLQATEKTQKPYLKRALNFYNNLDRTSDAHTINHINNFFSRIFSKILKKEGVLNKELDALSHLKTCIKNFYKIENEENHKMIFRAYHLFNSNLCRNKVSGETGGNGERIFFGAHQEANVQNEVSLFKNELNSISGNADLSYLNLFEASLTIRVMLDTLDNTVQFEHLSPVIHRFQKRKNEIDKLFAIGEKNFLTDDEGGSILSISMKKVNTDMKKIVPLLVTKKAYEQHRENPQFNTLHIIIDEAHNILSEDSMRETESWKDYRLEVFEEIIKEGRKFGVFLTLSSQRPSDISNTLISQVHNFFIHRLMNENDLRTINRTISFLDKASFDSLPILLAGSCIFTGTATETPIALQVPLLDEKYQPTSETINLDEIWF